MRRPGITPAVKALLIAMVAVFFVQLLGDRMTGGAVTGLLGLSWPGLKQGYLWQLVTYVFVHGNLFHLLLNGLVLFFMGPATERAIGTKQFYLLFLLSGVLGGVGWLLISSQEWAVCIGASGAVFGIIGAFAALFPHRPITLLLFFVLPITMKAWILAVSLAVLELLFLLGEGPGDVADPPQVFGAPVQARVEQLHAHFVPHGRVYRTQVEAVAGVWIGPERF